MARGRGQPGNGDLCVCTGAEYPSLFSSYPPTPLNHHPPPLFHSLCRPSPPLPQAPRGQRHWPWLWMNKVVEHWHRTEPFSLTSASVFCNHWKTTAIQTRSHTLRKALICHAVIRDLFQWFNVFPRRFYTRLAQINPFSRTKHLLARQRWWRNTLTLSDNITVLFESLGIVCPPCFTVLLRVLIHCRLCYLCVLFLSVGLLCIYRVFIDSSISHCLERRKKRGKKWASVLVRGLFLFDSLTYGDSAHEGNGVKRYSTCCIWGRTSGAKMKFHRNQLDEVWIECCQVILKKLLSVINWCVCVYQGW